MIGQLGNLGQLGLSGGSRQLTPRTVPGCMWEYDLYNWSTLFQDKNGTVPVTNYGQPIGLQLDLSGNGHHRYSESAARPTLELSASGKPCLYYPGIGRYMKTNPFAWASDEVCMIIGVRKISVNLEVLVEFSANGDTNNGAFYVLTPYLQSKNLLNSRGTVSALAQATLGTASPVTQLISAIAKIGLSIAKLYENNVLVASTSNTQGVGNYGTHPLYFGSRAGTSLFFYGEEYSSCGFNKIPTDAQFAAMNRYINNKTGAY